MLACLPPAPLPPHRATIIALFSPLLKRIGYGLTWRSATVMAWGGLRGAVGLALALTVAHNEDLDPTFMVQDKVMVPPPPTPSPHGARAGGVRVPIGYVFNAAR